MARRLIGTRCRLAVFRPTDCSPMRSTLLLLSALFMPVFASAQAGLPGGGKIDAQRVIAERYGHIDDSPGPSKPARAASRLVIPAGGITYVVFDAGARQDKVPVTFGQVFAPGDLKASDGLSGKLADGSIIPLQLDVKAHHADGSVRHAVISAVLPHVEAGRPLAMALLKAARSADDDNAPVTTLTQKGFTASFSATIDGHAYRADADKLLAKPHSWLSGPVVHEWLVDAPLRDAAGTPHPHLAAHYAIRWYPAVGKARVDLTVENVWAFEPGPRNFTYDAAVSVGGKQVYAKQGLTHYHHARWRKVFWWGGTPAVRVLHDSAYLMASRALPNYDRSVAVNPSMLAALEAKWTGPRIEPMGVGLALPGMPTTGGRADIGLLPGWAAAYLLSMDKRAEQATMGTADLAGSWSMHYRDRSTGLPVNLLDHPYMTMLGQPSDTRNPATGKSDAFPACAAPGACATPNIHDVSHEPSFAYLPYLLTGDYYYLEELQFWAMYDVFYSNPGYRQHEKGLFQSDQVRAQAWGMRTLGEAAYITPDRHPLKQAFVRILDANLDWYNAAYTNNQQANRLGAIVNGHAFAYANGTGIAPWQDDFFTSAIGHIAELGFDKARPLLAWKVRYPIARMLDPNACWIDGAIYEMKLRASRGAPVFGSIGEAWRASRKPAVEGLPCASAEMATALKLKVGEMTGYSSSPTGFPSNMQPALAFAADAGGDAGKKAWAVFMARSVKPDYGSGPQFAIVPRSVSGTERQK
jgi:hypothetical protein